MPLPKDKELLLEMLEDLEVFQGTRGFQAFREKLSALKDQASRLCREELEYPKVVRHQGEYSAYEKVSRVVEDLTKEIRDMLPRQGESSQ